MEGSKKSLGMSVKRSVGTINLNGTLFAGDSNQAVLLNKFFNSQTVLNEPLLLLTINKINNKYISALISQPVDIYKLLLSLDVSKACGPDGLSNTFLKEAALPLAQPLSKLFNFILCSDI